MFWLYGVWLLGNFAFYFLDVHSNSLMNVFGKAWVSQGVSITLIESVVLIIFYTESLFSLFNVLF